MQSIAYFDCYSGASGDMLLGALLDKSINFDWFCEELAKLNLPGDSYKIEKTYVNRSSISSCKINITLPQHEHHHRGYSDICKMIESSELNLEAKVLSRKIFHTLGIAEATIHNTSLEKIHFHEVGAIDSIIDIVGFSICISQLKPDKCIVSPLPVGSGHVFSTHGTLPVPAPATAEILKRHKATIKNNPYIDGECLTPTAAAILCTIANEYSSFPDFNNITSIGYGAGDKIFNEKVTSNLRFITGLQSDFTGNLYPQICIEAQSEKIISEHFLKTLPEKGKSGIIILKRFYPEEERYLFTTTTTKKEAPEILSKLKEYGVFQDIKVYEIYTTTP